MVFRVTVVTELLEDGSTTGAGLLSSNISVKLLQEDDGKIGLWLVGLGQSEIRNLPFQLDKNLR